MSEFKPMVKMGTDETKVILKLKKGGKVASQMSEPNNNHGFAKMAKGGQSLMSALASTPALLGRPAMNMPVAAPKRPSINARKRAMEMARSEIAQSGLSKASMPAPMRQSMPSGMAPAMKKGGEAEGGKMAMKNGGMHEMPDGKMMKDSAMKSGGKMDAMQDKAMIKKAFNQHDKQEHKMGKGTKLSLNEGGVSKKFAKGGSASVTVPSHKPMGKDADSTTLTPATAMRYAQTMKHTGSRGITNASTGKVIMNNGGGYKDGGYVDTGKPVAMPQGAKPVPPAKTQINFSGVYKKGGEVTTGNAIPNKRLSSINDAENAPSVADAKMESRLKYPKTTWGKQTTPNFK